jgi:hypothetical protein
VLESSTVPAPPHADEMLHLVIRGLLMEKVEGSEVRPIKVGQVFVQRHAEVRPDGAHVDMDGQRHEVRASTRA